jgi:MFS family permease
MRRPGPLTALVCEGFASRLAFGLLSFAVPLYGRSLGMSIAAIGVLASLEPVVAILLKPVLGRLVDRMGLRRGLLASLVLRSVIGLGYVLARLPWQLYAIETLHGASDAARDPAVNALIAKHGGEKAVASAFAWYQTAKTTAGAAGRAIAGALLASGAVGFNLTFTVAFALSLLPALPVLLLVPRDSARAHPVRLVETRRTRTGAAPPITRPPVARYAGLGFLISGTSSMFTSLYPILATEYAHLSPAQAGALYLVTPALAFTGPIWGWLADRGNRSLILAVRGIANAGSALLYLLAPSLTGIWVGKSIDDLGKAAYRPAWGSLIADISSQDPSRRGRTMGYLTAGEDAGSVAAPLLASLLWTGFGVPAALLGRVALALVTEAYMMWLAHRAELAPSRPGQPSPRSGSAHPESPPHRRGHDRRRCRPGSGLRGRLESHASCDADVYSRAEDSQ